MDSQIPYQLSGHWSHGHTLLVTPTYDTCTIMYMLYTSVDVLLLLYCSIEGDTLVGVLVRAYVLVVGVLVPHSRKAYCSMQYAGSTVGRRRWGTPRYSYLPNPSPPNDSFFFTCYRRYLVPTYYSYTPYRQYLLPTATGRPAGYLPYEFISIVAVRLL